MKLRFKNFITRHYAAILIGLLIVLMFFITGRMIGNIKSNIENIDLIKSPSMITLDNVPAIAAGEQYIVKEYDGRIGVFAPGDTLPLRVVQVYVAYLPEADRTELHRGIYVNGTIALEKILDDLRS